MLTKKKLSKRRVTTAVSSFLLLAFIIGCGSQEELSGDRNLIPDNNQTESHYNTANETTNLNNKISSNPRSDNSIKNSFEHDETVGVKYNLFFNKWYKSNDTSVNYISTFLKN